MRSRPGGASGEQVLRPPVGSRFPTRRKKAFRNKSDNCVRRSKSSNGHHGFMPQRRGVVTLLWRASVCNNHFASDSSISAPLLPLDDSSSEISIPLSPSAASIVLDRLERSNSMDDAIPTPRSSADSQDPLLRVGRDPTQPLIRMVTYDRPARQTTSADVYCEPTLREMNPSVTAQNEVKLPFSSSSSYRVQTPISIRSLDNPLFLPSPPLASDRVALLDTPDFSDAMCLPGGIKTSQSRTFRQLPWRAPAQPFGCGHVHDNPLHYFDEYEGKEHREALDGPQSNTCSARSKSTLNSSGGDDRVGGSMGSSMFDNFLFQPYNFPLSRNFRFSDGSRIPVYFDIGL
jgi:hypothetical protein